MHVTRRLAAVLLLLAAGSFATAGTADAQAPLRGPFSGPATSDGKRLVAADRPDGTTVVFDDAGGSTAWVARPDGCHTAGVGGDVVIFQCQGPFSGRAGVSIASGRELWHQEISAYDLVETPPIRRVGRFWFLSEAAYKGGPASFVTDVATATAHVDDVFDRAIVDPDSPSGKRRLCAPLRRRPDTSSLDENPFFAAYDGRNLLTYSGPRLLLERCGSRTVTVLQDTYAEDGTLAAGVAVWTRRYTRHSYELVAYDVRHRRRLGCTTHSVVQGKLWPSWTRTRHHVIRSTARPDGTFTLAREALPHRRCGPLSEPTAGSRSLRASSS